MIARMKTALWMIALCSCGGDPKPAGPVAVAPTAPIANVAVIEMPTADSFVAEVSHVPHPAAIVWIDAKGAVTISHTGPKWAGELPTGPRVAVDDSVVTLERTVLESAVADHGGASDDAAMRLQDRDDPPPPPEEEDPDESGGTGTAMALDEGKMGKKDSDRAEGQYKMHKDADDPQLARQQAIEAARTAGILGSRAKQNDTYGRNTVGSATRLDGIHANALVVAAPGAPAYVVARIASRIGAVIAVRSAGKVAALDAAYRPLLERSESLVTDPWLEIYVDSAGLRLVRMPQLAPVAVPWKAGTLDRDAFVAAFKKLRATGPDEPIDILVAQQGPTAQQLVDVLVALDGPDTHQVAIGELGGTADDRLAKLKAGHELAYPVVSVGQPNANGDLDKAIIRKFVKQNITRIQYCYEKQLLAKPGLKGTVQVQFFIAPDGHVASSAANGVDPDVSTCVAGVIKKITFPKPKGGGGVQVNYPFSFRSADSQP
jgi:hypothetical protein